jgi:hypothetical protein
VGRRRGRIQGSEAGQQVGSSVLRAAGRQRRAGVIGPVRQGLHDGIDVLCSRKVGARLLERLGLAVGGVTPDRLEVPGGRARGPEGGAAPSPRALGEHLGAGGASEAGHRDASGAGGGGGLRYVLPPRWSCCAKRRIPPLRAPARRWMSAKTAAGAALCPTQSPARASSPTSSREQEQTSLNRNCRSVLEREPLPRSSGPRIRGRTQLRRAHDAEAQRQRGAAPAPAAPRHRAAARPPCQVGAAARPHRARRADVGPSLPPVAPLPAP